MSAIQVMPPLEFAGDVSWGYNPAHLFAIESSYGGPDAFKAFVREAHGRGIAVIVDVVYNHLGPSDLDLWRFDGWGEGDGGGIYFYNDIRGVTLWGATRPDYGRGEVRTFLRDSAMTWLEEFRCDGLRFDSTVHMRTTEGYPALPGSTPLPDGWSFLAWMNDEIKARQPWKITIAEDLEDDPILVTPTEDGGAGFAAQWDAGFIRRVRPQLEAHDDAARDIDAVVAGILGEGRGDALSRVIYTESHDEVANGLVRVPEAIAPGAVTDNWWATKRAVLGSGLVLTSPGIPMLFQGQELLEDRWFDDTVSLDWEKTGTNRGILQLHRDLIALRRARDGTTRRPARDQRADPPPRPGGQDPGDASLDGGWTARRHGRHRELRRPDHRRPADRVPDARPLERALQLRRVDLRGPVRQPRDVRPRRRRPAAGRLRAERPRLGRGLQPGDLLARGLTRPVRDDDAGG